MLQPYVGFPFLAFHIWNVKQDFWLRPYDFVFLKVAGNFVFLHLITRNKEGGKTQSGAYREPKMTHQDTRPPFGYKEA